jgi:hypothetical protein
MIQQLQPPVAAGRMRTSPIVCISVASNAGNWRAPLPALARTLSAKHLFTCLSDLPAAIPSRQTAGANVARRFFATKKSDR